MNNQEGNKQMEDLSQEEYAELRTTNHLQVTLSALPGPTGAWMAHFQYGVVGIKSLGGEGSYISANYLLTLDEGRNFITGSLNHVRSLRPGSSNVYMALRDYDAEPMYWPIEGITYGKFIEHMKGGSNTHMTLRHNRLNNQVGKEIVHEEMEISKEKVLYTGGEYADEPTLDSLKEDLGQLLSFAKDKSKVTH